uniref:crossover junction endonuclease EME1-like n=1 Tax=Myxine glutinosa TaxID=7769 RepID=UPI00358E7469
MATELLVISSASSDEDDSPLPQILPLRERLRERLQAELLARDCVTSKHGASSQESSLSSIPGPVSHGASTRDAQKDVPLTLASESSNVCIYPRQNDAEKAPPGPQARGPKSKAVETHVARVEDSLGSGPGRGRSKVSTSTRRCQDAELLERRAKAAEFKAMKPQECMSYITVHLDTRLLEGAGGAMVLSVLQTMSSKYSIELQAISRSVRWSRCLPRPTSGDASLGKSEEEAQLLVLIPTLDFIRMVRAYKEGVNGLTGGNTTLRSFLDSIRAAEPNRVIMLAVVDLEKHFTSQRVAARRQLRKAVGGADGHVKRQRRKACLQADEPVASRVDVEEALTDLQLYAAVNVELVASWKGFADYIAMVTKAIAETPFKRSQEQAAFSFCLEADFAGGVRVESSGKGYLQLWKRQIHQLNRVGPEAASAIVEAYPSPRLLCKAYKSCAREHERVHLLANLMVRRGEGVTSTSRRVGSELSRRLHLLLTARDPDLVLDSFS